MGTELKNIRILNEEQFKSLSGSGYDTSTLYFVETPMSVYITDSAYVSDNNGVFNRGYKKFSDGTVEIWGYCPNTKATTLTVVFGGDTGVLPNAKLETNSLNIQLTPKVVVCSYKQEKTGTTMGNLGYGVGTGTNVDEDSFNILLSSAMEPTVLDGFYWKVTGKLK